MTNLYTTTALTEFTPLSPEQEQSSVSSFFSKVFSFKTSPTDGNDNSTEIKTEPIVDNVNMFIKNYTHIITFKLETNMKMMVKNNSK